jgi:beta-mannosidase
MKRKKLLNKNWILKLNQKINKTKNIDSAFLKKSIPATIPGTVHTDLYNAKLIPNPFYADNELKLDWISKSDWTYKTSFNIPEGFNTQEPIYLYIEGLDTVCNIVLNKQLIGNPDNMFRHYKFEITRYLEQKNNQLQVNFKSPLKTSQELQEKYGKLFSVRHHQRIYLRKAQYSFGWDWGPSFPTMGIWKPVYLLQSSEININTVMFDTKQISNHEAIVQIRIELEGKIENNNSILVELNNKTQSYSKNILDFNTNQILIELKMKNPALWWPNGYGDSNLYNLKITIFDDQNRIVDDWQRKIGIRKIQLVTLENDKCTFKFIINNKSIFIKGANWIPSDSFIPRLDKNKYEQHLNLAKDANINMIRVWGGGIYEYDYFYQLCDEKGLLVWQDFMFACSAYPEFPKFINNVQEEVEEIIRRIQYHPCLAIWCGNNENEWLWFRENMGAYEQMPGFKIFHQLIPELIKKLDPNRPYWPTSPFGNEHDPNDYKSGNQHSWDIWSRWVDYNEVVNDNSMFVTEFGFQSPANRQTLEEVIPDEQRKVQSELFEFHNKQIEGNERLFKFLSGNLPVETNWKDFIYLTQLNQGFALKTCIEHWRFNWPETMGSIIWQLNDCWPVTSWSLIDYKLIPKIAYYFVQNVYSSQLLKIKKNKSLLNILVSNQSKENFIGYVQLYTIDCGSGNMMKTETQPIKIEADTIKIHTKYNIPDDKYILVATLLDHNKTIINRNFYIGKKWKYMTLAKAEITVKLSNDKNNKFIIITVDKPTFFIDLYHPEINFSDRGFIILPGEEKKIESTGHNMSKVDLKKIEVFSLNNFLHK